MMIVTLLIGLLLRLWNIDLPDLATDEAQFILGASAAHPPLGMLLFRGALAVHHSITAARMVSVLAGIASVGVLFAIAQRTQNRRTAITVSAVAAVFPGHVLFSKSAYLDGLLILTWLLTILTYEHTRAYSEKKNGFSLFFLWAAAVASTFLKAQGFLFPLILLFWRIWEMRRQRPWRDPITGVLILSMVPITLYLMTSPEIVATLQLYGGGLFGLQNILLRFLHTFGMWWHTLLLVLPLGIIALPWLKQYPRSVLLLCLLAVLQPLLLGPGHTYYATELVVFALPIGLLITRLPRIAQMIALILCIGSACTVQLRTPTTYWNTHAESLNALLAQEERVIAVGPVGHHVRWYLRPEILVGNAMDLTRWNGIIVDLGTDQELPTHTVFYQDERLRLLRIGEP